MRSDDFLQRHVAGGAVAAGRQLSQLKEHHSVRTVAHRKEHGATLPESYGVRVWGLIQFVLTCGCGRDVRGQLWLLLATPGQ